MQGQPKYVLLVVTTNSNWHTKVSGINQVTCQIYNLKYNARGDLLQGYGQVTWPKHTYMVVMIMKSHQCAMLQEWSTKRLWKEIIRKKHVIVINVEQCCVPL